MAFSETPPDYEALFNFFFTASQYNPGTGDLLLSEDEATVAAWQDLSRDFLTERGYEPSTLRALSRMVVEDILDTHEQIHAAIPEIFAGTI